MSGYSIMSASYPSDEAKYVTYNYQIPELQKALDDIIQDSDNPHRPIIVLRGVPNVGRSYLLESACFRASMSSAAALYVPLDLRNWEADRGTLDQFAAYLLGKSQKEDSNALTRLLGDERLVKLVKLLPYGEHVAAFLALFTAQSLVDSKQLEIQVLNDGLSASPVVARDFLEGFLRRLMRERQVVIHVIDIFSISEMLLHWLCDNATAHHRLMLAISAPPQTRVDLPPRYGADGTAVEPAKYLDLALLTTDTVSEILHLHYKPNSFPRAFHEALIRYSDGFAGLVATKVFSLVRGGFLDRPKPKGPWQLQDDDFDGEAWSLAFDTAVYEPILTLQEQLDPELFGRVLKFLRLTALCGDCFPVHPLLEEAGIASRDAVDTVLDLIDEKFVDMDERPSAAQVHLFDDLGYSEPSFPGHLVYRFANPVVRDAILRRTTDEMRATMASRLLKSLQSRLALTRHAARLYLELATLLKSDEEQEHYRKLLAWWISLDAADLLTTRVSEAMLRMSITPKQVLSQADSCLEVWPPRRTLALLDALELVGVPFDSIVSYLYLRAFVLNEVGRSTEAIQIAVDGFDRAEKEPFRRADFQMLLGRCYLDQTPSNPAKAIEHFHIALALRGKVDRTVSRLLLNLGVAYHQVTNRPMAIEYLQRAIDNADCPATLIGALINISMTYIDSVGSACDEDEKDHFRQKALTDLTQAQTVINETKLPFVKERIYLLRNLGLLAASAGDLAQAIRLFDAAIELAEHYFGPGHGAVVQLKQVRGRYVYGAGLGSIW